MAGAENGPDPHLSKKAQGVHCVVLRRAFGQNGIKTSAANGWSGEWPKPKPTYEQEGARTALRCIATTVWPMQNKGFRSQRLSQTLPRARRKVVGSRCGAEQVRSEGAEQRIMQPQSPPNKHRSKEMGWGASAVWSWCGATVRNKEIRSAQV